MIEYQAEIVFNRRLTPLTFVLGLHAPLMALQSKPGQFVMLKVRSGTTPLLRRPFSVCAVQADRILLLYQLVGEGTHLMAEMQPGQKMSVLGPLGQGFPAPDEDQLALLVAGGIGIAPLIFLASRLDPSRYRFLAGFNTAEEIPALDRLDMPGLPLSLATDDGSSGYAGWVTGLLEKTLARFPSQKRLVLYACGPTIMLKKVAAIAEAAGITCRVSLESYMACGLGACQGCAIKTSPDQKQPYLHVCKDGPVFPAQVIDWTVL